MKRNLTLVFLVAALTVNAQNKYGLNPTTVAEYKTSLAKSPQKELVNLEKYIPGLVLDIRYATTNNFTGKQIYDRARAYARRPVADALKAAQAEFAELGVGIKVYDAYRPYKATIMFYETYHDTTYVASPYRGSRHNRGCAIDMTIVDLKTGKEISMPTPYDSFQKEAWPTTPVKDPVVRKNRDVLITTMERHGFKVNASEWWHFDFVGWNNFEVMDIDFSELEGL